MRGTGTACFTVLFDYGLNVALCVSLGAVQVRLRCLSGLAWSGLVWSGLVWSGLVWPGLAWPGLAWPGLVSYCSLADVAAADGAAADIDEMQALRTCMIPLPQSDL